ncbi:unnamed protein product, partial [Mesorhabditis belari]|uniref:Uncharacterized protein n=1 Tax=Mesorhabditis belari TaxID=2138241 RepID=A0AAF3FDR8_9BILA
MVPNYGKEIRGATFERVDTCPGYQKGDLNALKIYAHDIGLDLLRNNRTWTADGTFYAYPSDFAQLFIVGVQIGHLFIPCVFALLSGKASLCYKIVFRFILSQNIASPNCLMTDFERGIYQSFQQVSITKVADYFDALLVSSRNAPPPEVNMASVKKFYKFLAKNYIGKVVNGNFRRPPTYPVDKWNVYSRVIQSQQLGNATHEAFNSLLKSGPKSPHPGYIVSWLYEETMNVINHLRLATTRNLSLVQ